MRKKGIIQFHHSTVQRRGFFLIFSAILLASFLSIVAYFVGVSMVALGNLRLQNIANLSVVAALDGYMKVVPGESPTQRLYRAKESAAAVFENNSVFFGKKLNAEITLYGWSAGTTPGSTPSGTLELGVWNKKAPSTVGHSIELCAGGKYPCFNAVPISGDGSNSEENYINAARMTLFPESQLALRIPFVSFLLPTFTIQKTPLSIARVVERCVVMLLDVSLSTSSESHNFTPYAQKLLFSPSDYPFNNSPQCKVSEVGRPASCVSLDGAGEDYASYQAQSMGPASGRTHNYIIGAPEKPLPPVISARNAKSVDSCSSAPTSQEQMWWCNLGESRATGSFYPVDGNGGRNPTPIRANPLGVLPAGYRTDYGLYDTKIGKYYVDRKHSIDPLTTYLLSFNAALRTMQAVTSRADKAALIAFTGRIRDKVPTSGMVSDLGHLIQLTNEENGGYVNDDGSWKYPPISPNFIERGWIPLIDESANGIDAGTNLSMAVHEAIKTLDENCSKDARKVIVLATDGLLSWDYDRDGSEPYPLERYYGRDSSAPANDAPAIRQPSFPSGEALGKGSYWYAEKRLLSSHYSENDPRHTGILADLKKRNISVTVLLAGEHISVNYLNMWTDHPSPGMPQGHYLTLEEAPLYGFSGLGENTFFAWGSYIPDPLIPYIAHYPDPHDTNDPPHPCFVNEEDNFESGVESCAWRFAGKWNFWSDWRRYPFFVRPNPVMADLAWGSGGVMCPLMWKWDESYYYDHDGDPSTPKILDYQHRPRGVGTWSATEWMEPSEYAARCTRKAVESDPYELVITPE